MSGACSIACLLREKTTGQPLVMIPRIAGSPNKPWHYNNTWMLQTDAHMAYRKGKCKGSTYVGVGREQQAVYHN